MQYPFAAGILDLLRNQIDIDRDPFSDRGSRLCVKTHPKLGLCIQMAERLTWLQPGLETYGKRPPFIQNIHFIDGQGEILETHRTCFPHGIFFDTRIGTFGLCFHKEDTIAFGLPSEVPSGISFTSSSIHHHHTNSGGWFKSAQFYAYKGTNAFTLQETNSSDHGEMTIKLIQPAGDNPTIHLKIRSDMDLDMTVSPFNESLEAAANRWTEWFLGAPQVEELYRKKYYYAWWVMANNLISSRGRVGYEAMMPSKMKYIGVWNWDACFHAIGFRHRDPNMARDQLRTILDEQLTDGMIPDVVFDEGIVESLDHPLPGKVTKPPLLAWAALKIHELDPDIPFLAEIYPKIVRSHRWWLPDENGSIPYLAQYQHPYSSGMDNNPLWDYGMPVRSPDLNTYLWIQLVSMAEIAGQIGKDGDAAIWRKRADSLLDLLVRDLYDKQEGLFMAKCGNQIVPETTILNLFPVWIKSLPASIRNKLLGHLMDSSEFWATYPLRTVSGRSRGYQPDVMWRGPVWVNMNYMMIEALDGAGEGLIAGHLREKTIGMVMNHPGCFEYYHPDTGEPPESAAPTFGWTAALFIDLVLQTCRNISRGV